MSTTTYRPVPSAQAPVPAAAPAKKKGKNTGWIVATITAASLALLGMIAAIMLAFMPVTAPAPVVPADHTAVIVHHKTSKHTVVTPAHHSTTPVTPVTPVAPSDSIKLEQQQLGDLNYYEGPVNGYYTPATIDAVKCLQRDAGLPQTGQMDSATQAAMTTMLINGNNQMAG
jgi:peptidoglycan hydrolase-like protein with peptidoglycan-binding domain